MKTQLLILGTPHLCKLGNQYTPSLLDTVIGKLLEFHPDLICVERLSGEVTETMMPNTDRQDGVARPWWLETAPKMQKRLKVSRVIAERKLKGLLSRKRLTTVERLELILYMLANYDVVSAVLQWSYLTKNLRQTQQVIPEKIAKQLEQELHLADEVYSVALRLANHLKLMSCIAIDDHNYTGDEKMSMKQYQSAWQKATKLLSERNKQFMTESEQRLQWAVEAGDLLPFYEYCNSSRFSKEILDIEGESWLRTKPPSRFADMRLSQWEVRNLNMASHIRQAMMFHTGKRVLVIVGYSHKVFLERYLKQMLNVDVLRFPTI